MAEGAIPRAVRLVAMIRRLEAGEMLYASDLADEYGCSQRAIERDFKALARALHQATRPDPTLQGDVPSTKGAIEV